MIALFAALLLAQIVPGTVNAPPSPPPAPTPTSAPLATAPPAAPKKRAIVELEAGGSNSWLNEHHERWEDAYLRASYAAPSGFKLYAATDNSVRFGSSEDAYVIGTDIPTHRPNGVLDVGYVLSSRNDVIPQSAWYANYNLRAGGGYAYQFGYLGRSFSTGDAGNYGLGMGRYFGHQWLGYFMSFSTLSNRSGVGITQGLRWTHYLPMDTISTTLDGGRGVEATGRDRVAMHDLVGFDVDELHWIDPGTAIHVDAGYFSVTPRAYQRFLALVGLRVRF